MSTDGSRRTWFAASAASVPATVTCWSIVGAFVTESTGEPKKAAAAVALGLAVAPMVFVVVALLSGHPTPVFATGAAVLTACCVALPLLALRPDGVTGLVGGLGAGVAVSMRRPDQIPTEGRSIGARRATAVAAVTAVEALLVITVPLLAIASAPVLPLAAVAAADTRRAVRPHWR